MADDIREAISIRRQQEEYNALRAQLRAGSDRIECGLREIEQRVANGEAADGELLDAIRRAGADAIRLAAANGAA